MPCCLLCFSDEPHPDDPRVGKHEQFAIRMIDAPCKEPFHCLSTYCCPWCSAYYVRQTVLGGTLENYTCCQGYMDGCGFKAGNCGERSCPQLCLCFESVCCLGPSMSASRIYVMDEYDLASDPCDLRMIRLVNCIMMVSCILDIIAIIIEGAREAADIFRCIANAIFYSTLGCMAGQVHHEVEHRKTMPNGGKSGNQQNIAYAQPGGYEPPNQVPVVKASVIND